MNLEDMNRQFAFITKRNDLLGKLLQSFAPDYDALFGSVEKVNELLDTAQIGVMQNYDALLGSVEKVNELLDTSQMGVMQDYDALFGSVEKVNGLLNTSQMGAMQDYHALLGSVAEVHGLLNTSLMRGVPDFVGALSGFTKAFTDSFNGMLLDHSSLLNSINEVSGFIKGFELNDVFLSKEYIDTYCEENDIADEDSKAEIQDFAEDLSIGKCIDGNMLSDSQKKFFATYIYPFILMIIPLLFQSLTAQPTIVNNKSYIYSEKYYKTKVNNYYTRVQELNKDILNIYNVRFVSEAQIIVRKCADNTSSVVSKLPLGKVVTVITKHKKWIQISWKDEKGNCFSGWVQKWKVSKFK